MRYSAEVAEIGRPVYIVDTPCIKFYNFFQIGTLSTVIESEGCMMVLWKHECTRVFSDRFTVEEDKTWFNEELLKVVEEHLGPELRTKTEPSPVFVDFMR